MPDPMVSLKARIQEVLKAVDEGEEMDESTSVYEIDDELVDQMIGLLREVVEVLPDDAS